MRAYYTLDSIQYQNKFLGLGFRTGDGQDFIIMRDGGLAKRKRSDLSIEGVSADEFENALQLFYQEGESDTEAHGGTAVEILNRRARR